MGKKLSEYGSPVKEILAGDYDDQLNAVISAAQHRQKTLFRKGTRVRVVGTGNHKTDGQIGVVLKTNPKTITVAVGEPSFAEWDTDKQFPTYSGGEWNMTSNYLEVVAD